MSSSPAVPNSLMVRVRVTELLDEFYGRIDRGESMALLQGALANVRPPHYRCAPVHDVMHLHLPRCPSQATLD